MSPRFRRRHLPEVATRAATSPEPPRKRRRALSPTGPEHRDDSIDESKATSIYAALSTLLHSEKFSDMSIVCGERRFETHRAVLCTQSSFFDRAMSGDWVESTSRSIELPEDDPDVVERFLEFMYTGTYTDGVNSTPGKPSEAALLDPETVSQRLQQPAYENQETGILTSNTSLGEGDGRYKSAETLCREALAAVQPEELKEPAQLRNNMTLPLRLYVMADKYDVPALGLLARDRFYRAVKLVWEEAECFPDVVDELYQTTPSTDTTMRDIVCRLVAAEFRVARVREKMRSVMMKHGEFAVGVIEHSIHLHSLFV